MPDDKPRGPEPRNPNKEEDLGYRYYPSRSPDNKLYDESSKGWWQKLNEGRAVKYEFKCISNVMQCLENNKLIKVLVSALKKNGCDFDIKRHISCENCTSKVNGGYDPHNNQIVVCQNTSTRKQSCCSVITHELIHMFDFCRAKADFTNLDHLACTEECVKRKAIMSILMVRNITYEDASAVVEKVFRKCYKDLEPFGRIPRAGSTDPEKIFVEGQMYGFGE